MLSQMRDDSPQTLSTPQAAPNGVFAYLEAFYNTLRPYSALANELMNAKCREYLFRAALEPYMLHELYKQSENHMYV